METKKRILVVDDDTVSLQLIGGILRPYYDLSMAISANIALKILENSTFLVDLIILDFSMPKVNGDWLLEMMEKLDIQIPVIMLTGEQGANPLKIAQHSNIVFKYMKKPPSSRILLEEISRILSKQDFFAQKEGRSTKRSIFKNEVQSDQPLDQHAPKQNIEDWRGVIGIVNKISFKPNLKVIAKTVNKGDIVFSIEKKGVWHGIGVPAAGTPIVLTDIIGDSAGFARPYNPEKDKHLFGKELTALNKKLHMKSV